MVYESNSLTDPLRCEEIVKCKGFITNSKNSLSFDKIKVLLDGGTIECNNDSHITRTKRTFEVFSKPLNKEYTFTLNKRVQVIPTHTSGTRDRNLDFDTVPYGFRNV